jgi:hypothetical protein
MTSKFLATKAGRAFLLAATGAVAFVLSMVILRHGLRSWPDSWYDWQGSINLIEHGSYTTMLGVSIHDWPPLYSAYLALFQLIFGQTGWTLMLSTAALAALNAVVWGAYTFKVFPEDEKTPPTFLILASLGYLALFLPLNFISILPNGLLLLFIGLVLHLLAAMAEDSTQCGGVRKAILIGLLLGAGVFTHNSTIIFIAASVIVVFAYMPTSLRQRFTAIAVILIISGIAWMLVPHGLTVAHHTESAIITSTGAPAKVEQGTHFLFQPKYSLWEYLVQHPEGYGVFFLSMTSIPAQTFVGWVILGAAIYLLYRRPETEVESRQRVFLAFGLLGALGHFLVFNIIWLDTIFGDRFAWYFVMICVPIFFSRFRRHTLVIAVMLVMVLGVSGWRVIKKLRTGEMPVLVADSNVQPINAIHPEYFLTSLPNAVVPPGEIEIEAPIYRWQSTVDGAPSPNVHENVILVRRSSNSP